MNLVVSKHLKRYRQMMAQPVLYMIPGMIDTCSFSITAGFLASEGEVSEEATAVINAVFLVIIISAMAGTSVVGLEIAEQSGEDEEVEEALEEHQALTRSINRVLCHAVGMVGLYSSYIIPALSYSDVGLQQFGINEQDAEFAYQYFNVYKYAIPALLYYQSYLKFNAALKNNALNIWIMLGKCSLEVGLNYYFGVYLHEGVQGCAKGSVITYYATLCVLRGLMAYYPGYDQYRLNNLLLCWHPSLLGADISRSLGKIVKYGKNSLALFFKSFGITMQALCVSASALLITSIINSHFSQDVRDAYTVLINTSGLLSSVFGGLCLGQSFMLADMLGKLRKSKPEHVEDNTKDIQSFIRYCFFHVGIFVAATSCLYAFGSHALTDFFLTSDEKPYHQAHELLLWQIPNNALDMIYFLLAATFLSAARKYFLPALMMLGFVTLSSTFLADALAPSLGVAGVFGSRALMLGMVDVVLTIITTKLYSDQNIRELPDVIHKDSPVVSWASLHGALRGYDRVPDTPRAGVN